MVVSAAVLVEVDQKQRVVGVRTTGGCGGPDRIVDPGQQGLAAGQGGWRVVGQAREQALESRVHVVVPVQHVRLDEGVGRQLPLVRVFEELVSGPEVRREPVPQPGCVDDAGKRHMAGRVAVDPPGEALGLEALEERLRGVVNGKRLRRRSVEDEARRRARVEERPVGERLRWHVAEPVIEGREATGECGQDRQLLGRVAGHDLGVLVVARQLAVRRAPGADVVRHEAVHGWQPVQVTKRVVGRGHLQGRLAAVGRRVDETEELRVDVLVLLARVRLGGVQGGRDPIGHGCWSGPVPRPVRDRVAEFLADHPLERRDLAWLVQPAEQVVERAVLEHDDDNMVEGIAPVEAGHRRTSLSVGHGQLVLSCAGA